MATPAAARQDNPCALCTFTRPAGRSLPANLNQYSPLRKVSLVKLEAACRGCLDEKTRIPNEMQYLAGLQRMDFVFAYPDENALVIAGPAEGFVVDAGGRALGG